MSFFTLKFFENSFLVVRVKLPLPSQVILLDGHRTKDNIAHRVADRHHGQLRLHGVDHVGHGLGEVLEGGSVDFVGHNTDTEYLQGDNVLMIVLLLNETFSIVENIKMGLNLKTLFILL